MKTSFFLIKYLEIKFKFSKLPKCNRKLEKISNKQNKVTPILLINKGSKYVNKLKESFLCQLCKCIAYIWYFSSREIAKDSKMFYWENKIVIGQY